MKVTRLHNRWRITGTVKKRLGVERIAPIFGPTDCSSSQRKVEVEWRFIYMAENHDGEAKKATTPSPLKS